MTKEQEIEQLRETNRKLHRRVQQAEALSHKRLCELSGAVQELRNITWALTMNNRVMYEKSRGYYKNAENEAYKLAPIRSRSFMKPFTWFWK